MSGLGVRGEEGEGREVVVDGEGEEGKYEGGEEAGRECGEGWDVEVEVEVEGDGGEVVG